jgi:anti-sigma B factor antagonist
MRLEIREGDEQRVRVLSVIGEIDMASAPELSTRLNVAVRCTSGGVVLDLSGVELIDSTGISVLLNALRRMTRARRRLALVCPPGPVLRALRLTRLDSTFLVRDNLADAVAAALPPVPQPAVT